MTDWIPIAAATATVALLIAAGINDVARYRIPNWIVYAIVAAFVVGTVFSFSWPAFGWSLLAGASMFLLGAALFALGLFGGGDVKLVAAMALWTGIADLPRFLLVMTATGGVLGVVWLVLRWRRRRISASASAGAITAPEGTVAPENASLRPAIPNKLPYGVAIAVAGLDFFLVGVHSPFAHFLPWSS